MSVSKAEIKVLDQEVLNDDAAQFRQKLKSLKGKPASKKSIILSVFGLIPFFNKLLADAAAPGSAITSLVKIEGHVTDALNHATNTFPYIKLVTTAINFIRIPCIYVGAFILNKKPPITLSNNAQFLYSTILLGLMITALAYPPAAPIIGLVGAFIALGVSAITWADLYASRDNTEKKLKDIEDELNTSKNMTLTLIDELENIEKQANKAKAEGHLEKFNSLEQEIKLKKEDIDKQLDVVQKLQDQQEYYKKKLGELGTTAALDKTVGVALSTLALIGMVVSLFVPPVGAGLLIAAASIGLTYGLGRMTYPYFKSLGQKISAFFSKKPEANAEQNEQDLETNKQQQLSDHIISSKLSERKFGKIQAVNKPEKEVKLDLDVEQSDPDTPLTETFSQFSDYSSHKQEVSEDESEGEAKGQYPVVH